MKRNLVVFDREIISGFCTSSTEVSFIVERDEKYEVSLDRGMWV